MKYKTFYQAFCTALRASIEDTTEIDKRGKRYIIHFNCISERIQWKRFIIETQHAFDEFASEARNRLLHANNKTYSIVDVEKHLDWFMVTVEEVK